ncbi:Arc/MetJ-type ribon-helix-helix transcriptional regulator [Bradyrhizobium sp. JR3.12]
MALKLPVLRRPVGPVLLARKETVHSGNPVGQKLIDAARGRGPEPEPEPSEAPSKTKSLTVRMPANHQAMLDECMERWECDKSEAVKRAIRLAHSVLSSKEARLTTVDATGDTATTILIKNGVPT